MASTVAMGLNLGIVASPYQKAPSLRANGDGPHREHLAKEEPNLSSQNAFDPHFDKL
jgi:hypothetical protein